MYILYKCLGQGHGWREQREHNPRDRRGGDGATRPRGYLKGNTFK